MLIQFRLKKIKINQKIKVNKIRRTETVATHAFSVIQLETNAKTIHVQKIKINQKLFRAITNHRKEINEFQLKLI